MQTVQEPDEVAVPPDDFAVAAGAGDFIVAVLEEKHSLFLRDGCDRDGLFDAVVHDAAAS
jgi:hypothetical protein